MRYYTKSPGTGGSLLSEDDFIVEEIPSKKFLIKYERTSGKISPVTGPYFLYLLKKRGLTTAAAMDFICRKYSLKKDDIGFAGLKDKFAATSQYITIREKIEDFESSALTLRFVSPCKNMMQMGELESNNFHIVLHNCERPNNIVKIIRELDALPNYFGRQRFGIHENHKIGRLLLQRKYVAALKIIDSGAINKRMLKFYINAYQSYLFNEALDDYLKKSRKPLFADIAVPGFKTKIATGIFGKKMAGIMKKDGVSDFQFSDLRLSCSGFTRRAFVRIKNINYKIDGGNNISLEFTLPPGSYATVLLREVTKNGHF